MPRPDAIVLPDVNLVEVRMDSVQTILNSMVLLIRSEELSGLNSWIYETAGALSPEQKAEHELVLIGLHYAVMPTRYWKDFPSYLAHLECCDPGELRDQLLDFYIEFKEYEGDEPILEAGRASLLDDEEFFLEYITAKFGEEYIDRELESRAFALLTDPPRMRERITAHLRMMWDEHFQAEWDRIQPMLADAVMAFEEVDFSAMDREEAARYIAGRELNREIWDSVADGHQLVFVPSAHNGPYLGKFHYKNVHGIIFSARLPDDTQIHAPDLSRNQITIRLSALADDLRLQILKLIAGKGELKSQEIMDQLDLSQSAASRHLKQLSATGYLIERRCSGAKCYSLNQERVQDTLRAVAGFLLCE